MADDNDTGSKKQEAQRRQQDAQKRRREAARESEAARSERQSAAIEAAEEARTVRRVDREMRGYVPRSDLVRAALGISEDLTPEERLKLGSAVARPRRRNLNGGMRALGAVTSLDGSTAGTSLESYEDIPPTLPGDLSSKHDYLDHQALRIIDLLRDNEIELVQLKKFEQDIFYRYIYRSNPIIGRIIDLHTDLPLSKVRLQPPKDVPEVLRDYVLSFFHKIFDRLDFEKVMREIVIHQYVFGGCDTLVDDCYLDSDRILQPDRELNLSAAMKLGEESETLIATLEKRYRDDPSSLTLEERMTYLETKLVYGFDQKYRGPDRLQIIPFWKVKDRIKNEDIDYEAVEVGWSESLEQLEREGATDVDLRAMGYTEGLLRLLAENAGEDGVFSKTYMLENDSYLGLPWLLRLERADGTSILQRVWKEALEWDTAKSAILRKLARIGAVGRVVSAPTATEEQLAVLVGDVELMLEDPSFAIVCSFDVTWEEVNTYVKDELTEIGERLAPLTEELTNGMSMSPSLISGEAQTSNDQIRVEAINTYYRAFSDNLLKAFEEGFVKPVARRKGFYILDEWGDPKLVYPKMSFTRIGIRSEEVYSQLQTLYQDGNLPLSTLLDLMNMDIDDVRRSLSEELYTTSARNFNTLVDQMIGEAATEIFAETDFKDRLIANLPFTRRQPAGEDEDRDLSDEDFDPGEEP